MGNLTNTDEEGFPYLRRPPYTTMYAHARLRWSHIPSGKLTQLWKTFLLLGKLTIYGKTHYFYGHSAIAMWNYQRVNLVNPHTFRNSTKIPMRLLQISMKWPWKNHHTFPWPMFIWSSHASSKRPKEVLEPRRPARARWKVYPSKLRSFAMETSYEKSYEYLSVYTIVIGIVSYL